MKYEKGQSGNLSGRPAGVKNKDTARLREWVTKFLEENLDQLREDWKALEPRERFTMFEKLLKYSLPTLQATALTNDYERLTDEDLDKIITGLKRA